MIVCYRKPAWHDPEIDRIVMPLGIEVVRGLKQLISKRTSYTKEMHISFYTEEEGGLREGMGSVLLAHELFKEIGRDHNSRVVHVNSGLYLLGRNEI